MSTNTFRLQYIAKAAAGVPRDLVNTFINAKVHPIRPTVLIYNCTWVCDAKCTMCNNWKWGNRKEDMTLEQLEPAMAHPFWSAVENSTGCRRCRPQYSGSVASAAVIHSPLTPER